MTPTPAPSNSRRQFLKGAAAAATGFTIVPRHVLGGPRHVAPSEKVNVALVGAGGMGRSNLKQLFALDDVQVISVVDPAGDYPSWPGGSNRHGRLPTKADIEKHYAGKTPNFQCKDYQDFRVMLEREKEVDAVLCATPDHLHAVISAAAMRSGRHVYCEKPLTHNLAENRKIAAIAKETGVATQMGNQGTAQDGIRETIELVRSGAVGPIQTIHTWVPASRYNVDLVGRPAEGLALPDDFDWDLWLGPREPRDFHSVYHPFTWRDFWDFGSGSLGDFACHDLNASVRAFDLPLPERVTAHSAGKILDEVVPIGAMAYYDFPATDSRPAIRLNWYDSGLKPRKPGALGEHPLPRRGTLFIGEKGVILTQSSGSAPLLFPESLRESTPTPPQSLPRSPGHHREWIDACKGGPAAGSHFEFGAHLTEISLMGLLALRTGKTIGWNAGKQELEGAEDIQSLIEGSYRPGWEVL
ncbi:MAG: Gfo/Idh/MocA family oxidoreductase [Verrucomicrobiaceae bacterium]|nr:Gfo/Idh/MocA family oxidoreductase [Verrucomicrobiaceae bacterium]